MVDVGSTDQQTLIAVGQHLVRALNNLVAVTNGKQPNVFAFSDRLRGIQIDGSIPAAAAEAQEALPLELLRPGTPDAPVPAMIDPNLIITTQELGPFAGYLEFVLPDGVRIRVPFIRTS